MLAYPAAAFACAKRAREKFGFGSRSCWVEVYWNCSEVSASTRFDFVQASNIAFSNSANVEAEAR